MRRQGWLVDVALLALFAALTAALAAGALLDLDRWLRDWVDAHRPPPARAVAFGLNFVGQGGPLLAVSAVLAGWLAWRGRTARPLLPVAAAFVGLYGVIGALKVLTDRAAPHHPEDLVRLFTGGLSYPSGHVANTIVWYGVLVLLLDAALPAALPVAVRRLLRIGPPVIVGIVTTYLGFHWITDTVGGLLVGLLLDRLLHRVDWNAVPLERLPGGRWLAARGLIAPMR